MYTLAFRTLGSLLLLLGSWGLFLLSLGLALAHALAPPRTLCRLLLLLLRAGFPSRSASSGRLLLFSSIFLFGGAFLAALFGVPGFFCSLGAFLGRFFAIFISITHLVVFLAAALGFGGAVLGLILTAGRIFITATLGFVLFGQLRSLFMRIS